MSPHSMQEHSYPIMHMGRLVTPRLPYVESRVELRSFANKAEYFETLEIQRMIRSGYSEVLSGNSPTDTPFDEVEIIGPILTTRLQMNSHQSQNEL